MAPVTNIAVGRAEAERSDTSGFTNHEKLLMAAYSGRFG